MRIRTLALATFALSLALPALSAERSPDARRAGEAVQALRAEILLQTELARPILGAEAVELLQERARFARRLDQLELVAEDGLAATDAVLETGGDAAELLLRSPSAALLLDDSPRVHAARNGQRSWTRGSWMDSPDGNN